MSKGVRTKKLLVVAMGLSLVVFAVTSAAAQESVPDVQGRNAPIQPGVVLANKKQTKVTIDQNAAIVFLPPNTYVPIDSAKVLNCGTTSCVISAEMTVQLCPGSTTEMAVGFRFVVDGGIVSGSDWVAHVLHGTFCTQGHARIATPTSLPPGNHTVQTFVAVGGSASQNYHHVKYTQFKP
jgi:hypothetical protein